MRIPELVWEKVPILGWLTAEELEEDEQLIQQEQERGMDPVEEMGMDQVPKELW